MTTQKVKRAIILGAGFSSISGLPLQSEFPTELLSLNFGTIIDRTITSALEDFLRVCFGWETNEIMPSLEDIFTMIDISTSKGETFGKEYTPKKLRALRRMLIYRVFQILNRDVIRSTTINKFLTTILGNNNEVNVNFITLNWDILLEKEIANLGRPITLDYCFDGNNLGEEDNDYAPSVKIAKVHGSSNWVYCDNCHKVFYDRQHKLSLSIKAGIKKSDLRLFRYNLKNEAFDNVIYDNDTSRKCKYCQSDLGPLIATFSMKKSFRTHALTSSWYAAEKILDEADEWIFIGYSLPYADFEFKHLLKTCQLKRPESLGPLKTIKVILKNDNEAANRYISIFGKNSIEIFRDGLEGFISNITCENNKTNI